MNRLTSNRTIKAYALLLTIVIGFTLSDCSIFIPNQASVQQGNIITPEMVSQLKLGMTTDQVKTIMGGTPVLMNSFSSSDMTYIYTYRPSKKKMTTKKVILTFKNGKLANIQTEPSDISQQAPATKP